MGRVAAETKKGRRLAKQVVGDGTMRLMTVIAILSDRWMLPHKWTLLLGVTLVTKVVNRRCLEIPSVLTMPVVTARTDQTAFPNGMVGRHAGLSVYFRVTLVARIRLVNAHRQWPSVLHGCVINGRHAHGFRVRVRIMAIGTRDTFPMMG